MKTLLICFKILISSAVVIYLILNYDFSKIEFNKINEVILIISSIITLTAFLAICIRLFILTSVKSKKLKLIDIVKVNAVSNLFGVLLPSVLPDVIRVYYIKLKLNLQSSIIYVSTDRLAGLIAKILFIIVALIFFLISEKLVEPIYIILFLTMLLYLLYFLFNLNFEIRKRIIKILSIKRFLSKKRVISIFQDLDIIFRKDIFTRVISLSLFVQLCDFMIYYVIGAFLNLGISFFQLMLIIPISTFVAALPVSINKWTIRSTLIMTGIVYFGVPENLALELAVFKGLLEIMFSIIFGLIFILLGTIKTK